MMRMIESTFFYSSGLFLKACASDSETTLLWSFDSRGVRRWEGESVTLGPPRDLCLPSSLFVHDPSFLLLSTTCWPPSPHLSLWSKFTLSLLITIVVPSYVLSSHHCWYGSFGFTSLLWVLRVKILSSGKKKWRGKDPTASRSFEPDRMQPPACHCSPEWMLFLPPIFVPLRVSCPVLLVWRCGFPSIGPLSTVVTLV